jgi:dephospho-CoA kinase
VAAILVTGMSGAGKSTALAALAARGFATVDTDEPGWIEVVDGEPLWIEHRVADLLDRSGDRPLVVVGTVANQGRFADRFAAIVLLTAPVDVLLERLRSRAAGEFGATERDRAAVRRDVAETEPRLRAIATHIVDSTGDPDAVAERLAAVALAAAP